jgi:transposase-like protein
MTCAKLLKFHILARHCHNKYRKVRARKTWKTRHGSIMSTEVYAKVAYREVIEYLKKGYTIRDVAKLGGKGVSTVQRVKKEFVDI